MMIRKLLLFFYFAFIAFSNYAQDQLVEMNPDHKLSISAKLQPFMLINPDKPYVQAAIELGYARRVFLELGYGRRFVNTLIANNDDKSHKPYHRNFRGYSYSISVMFALSKSNDWQVGFNYRYFDDLRNTSLEYMDTLLILPNIKDVFTIDRKISIYSLRLYRNFEIESKLFVSCFLEIGFKERIREIDGEEFEFNPTSGRYDRIARMFGPTHDEYEDRRFHFMPGFYLTYRLY